MEIVTINSDNCKVLRQKVERIKESDLPSAREIAEKLWVSLKPYFPAAGLAAPQIGISKAIFIYSPDRKPENLEIVINPDYTPIGNETIEEWEACFSVILSQDYQIAKIKRFRKIKVNYTTIDAQKVEKILEGFAAKVFQHECDHLEGIINIERKDSLVKKFNSKDEFLNFINIVKQEDSKSYSE